MKRAAAALLTLMLLAAGCASVDRRTAAIPPALLNQPAPAAALPLLQQAEAREKAGDIPAAIALYEDIAGRFPENAVAPRSLARAGNLALANRKPDQALRYFEAALAGYPQWEGAPMLRVDRLRALWARGERRQVVKEGLDLWNALNTRPDVQVPLAAFMAGALRDIGDHENALTWCAAGYGKAQTEEQKAVLAKATLEAVRTADEASVQKMLRLAVPPVMKPFLELRLAQIEMQRGRKDQARNIAEKNLREDPTHPAAPEFQAILGGRPVGGPGAISTGPAPYRIHWDRVGCLLPLSGQYGNYGQQVMRGLSLAAEEWNRAHPDTPVSLVAKDTQADPERTRGAFDELTRDYGVAAVIGPLDQPSVRAAGPSAMRVGVPLLALTRMDEDAAGDVPPVLHAFMSNRDMLRSLVRYCRERLSFARFAVLAPADRYGERLAKDFEQVVKELGGELTGSASYDGKATDFKKPIAELMGGAASRKLPGVGAPFDALLIPDQAQTVGLIAPQLPYYNVVGVTLLGTNLWDNPSLVQIGGAYVEQALFATPFFTGGTSPETAAFRDRFQSQYGVAPGYLEAQGYDALRLVLNARRGLRGGETGFGPLLQGLLSTRNFPGATGTLSFTPAGTLDRVYQVVQVVSGRPTQVAP